VKPVHQQLLPMHPRKETAIKGDVEKFLKAGFIYLIPLTGGASIGLEDAGFVDRLEASGKISYNTPNLNIGCGKWIDLRLHNLPKLCL